MLTNIRIVLNKTSHPGNIGSAARAMKTMGLRELYLVAPKLFPHPKAMELASGADDVLKGAKLKASLDEVVSDCQLLIASSCRPREISLPCLSAREAGLKVWEEAKAGRQVAVLFGNERTGLPNETLLKCHYHAMIPTDLAYSSLNLAQAVQVFCYEIAMAGHSEHLIEKAQDEYACHADMERFFQHLERVMIKVDFLDPANPKRLLPRLRRLFNRSRMEETELHILRGILTMVEKKISKNAMDFEAKKVEPEGLIER